MIRATLEAAPKQQQHTVYARGERLVRYIRAKVQTPFGPTTSTLSRTYRTREGMVTVTFDMEAICKQLATRAMHTKGLRSSTFHGHIVATVHPDTVHDLGEETELIALHPQHTIISKEEVQL